MEKFKKIFLRELLELTKSKAGAVSTDIIKELADEISERLFNSIINNSNEILRENKRVKYGFEKRNKRRWKLGFDKLYQYILITIEIGNEFNQYYRPTAVKEQDCLFEAISYLHARSCLVANEVYALLECGHADGGLARWRTLHELAAISLFISNEGKDIAERYLEHEYITQIKGMKSFNTYAKRLGQKPFRKKEIKEGEELLNRLKQRYGSDFPDPYGWAVGKLKDPKFISIEEAAGIEHLRPYYKWSLQKTHAGHVRNFADLGTSEARSPLLLVGVSNSGMTAPAHLTAISLLQVSVALLNLRPTSDSVIYMNLLQLFEKDIGDTFLRIQLKNNK